MTKIVCISDTHAKHRQLSVPKGDIIIHAGDIMSSGYNFEEIEDFADWYGSLPHKYKIMIAGNHDRLFDDEHMKTLYKHTFTANDCETVLASRGIIYLNDSSININNINFWGSPVQPEFFNWAFNRERGEQIDKHWQLIPENTDVLITHGPPLGFNDLVMTKGSTNNGQRVGCDNLAMRILEVQPKICVHGHIHEMYGQVEHNGIKYINASVLDQKYQLVNKPIVVNYD